MLLATLEKDHIAGQDEALLDIYRKLRPGEPPTKESAQALLENLFFKDKRYDLAKVGRYKLNKKLGLNMPTSVGTLTEDDLVATVEYLLRLHEGQEDWTVRGQNLPVETDDIDHFGNRRLRTVGELIQNQIRVGLSRMERVVRERMTTQDVEAITPQTLINIRPVVASIKEFFGTSQLSQFMDQTNPLAGLTHKRRLSALGPGGLSRDRASLEVRDVHPSHYGRMCPIETPEGPNIGLIGSLATFARVNPFGFIETPYRKVDDGTVTDEIDYLTADEEDRLRHRPGRTPSWTPTGTSPSRGCWSAVRAARSTRSPPTEVEYMDVSPRQTVSVATAMIPFLEHDEANRALMGANMQRQSVPLLRSESPLVGTGMEARAAVDAGDVVIAEKTGVVEEVTADYVSVMADDGTHRTYRLHKFRRSNQGTSFNQKPIVDEGQRVEAGQVIADGPCTDGGEMALGKNLLVAFMPWEGHNYEDAIILSQRIVQDDVLTSIHIEEHEIDARDTKLGPGGDHPGHPERLRGGAGRPRRARHHPHRRRGAGRRHPGRQGHAQGRDRADPGGAAAARDLRREGPRGPRHLAQGAARRDRQGHRHPGVQPRRRRRRAASGRQRAGPRLRGAEAQDPGRRQAGRPPRQQGRHRQDPARWRTCRSSTDGTPVDIVLNPHGVPRRMNVGQILETHLGWVAAQGWTVEGDPDWAAGLADSARSADAVHPDRDAGVRRRLRGRRSSACSARTDRRPETATGWSVPTARRRCSTAAPASRSRTRWPSATCTSSSCSTWWTTRSTPGPPARTR